MPMIVEEGVGIVRKMMVVCRSPRIDKLTISIVIRVCLYTDSVLFGIRILVISVCNSLRQGINIDLVAM